VRRLLVNLAWFTVAMVTTFCVGLKAYASTATTPYGPITFQGEKCDELRKSIQAAYYLANPGTPYSDFFNCSAQRLPAGAHVNVFYRNGPAGSLVQVAAVDVATIDSPDDVGGYVGFIGLACCFGLGVIGGKMR
jgi:hypothetical protein